ncbi:hypothetical protein ACD591_05910 [Rufibacter glacialis]|uniref:Uncharacterized protein n=1 Tax=Rufibacter glacialis TaxID=1259555 RepID=A0A5M8QEM0_9BACT|nr:hypothetical protein [Rufibacter glacialis]KAA6433196.1 hypothetical protein FOE74_11960 [Rufibacter glacialis]
MLLVLVLLVWGGIACKRMSNVTPVAENEMDMVNATPDPGQEMPPVSGEKPVAPNHARVVLLVVKVLPDLAPAGNGPCSQAPCKAEVQVVQLMGYGSAFEQTLAPGQKLRVHFPMSVKAVEGRPGVTAGKKIKAELRGSLNEGDPLVVRSYTVVD